MGILVALLGVAVLAVAIFAIANPRGGSPAAAGSTSSSTSSSNSLSSSSSPSKPATSSSTSRSSTSDVISTSGSPTTLSLKQAQQVPLVVLNNSTISGLAAEAEQQFQGAGWQVSSIGNLVNDIISTCAYYDPSVPDAKAAAKVLKHEFPSIKRVRPKFAELPSGPIVVVLTSDYSAQ